MQPIFVPVTQALLEAAQNCPSSPLTSTLSCMLSKEIITCMHQRFNVYLCAILFVLFLCVFDVIPLCVGVCSPIYDMCTCTPPPMLASP